MPIDYQPSPGPSLTFRKDKMSKKLTSLCLKTDDEPLKNSKCCLEWVRTRLKALCRRIWTCHGSLQSLCHGSWLNNKKSVALKQPGNQTTIKLSDDAILAPRQKSNVKTTPICFFDAKEVVHSEFISKG